MKKKAVIIQDESPVEVQVMEKAVLGIASGLKSLEKFGLRPFDLITLIQARSSSCAGPYGQSKPPKKVIEAVLDSISGLQHDYCQKKPVKVKKR